MDRRGHGDSTDGKTYSLAREADDIVEVSMRLAEPVFVLGHSFGGIAVLEALKRTDRFKRAALYEPPVPVPGGVGHQSPKPICDAIAAGDNAGALTTFFTDYAHLPAPVITGLQHDPSWPQRVKLAPTLCREATAVETYQLQPESFAQIKTPVLFLLGGKSAQPMATSVRTAAKAMRNSPVTILPGQQHDAMYTGPGYFGRSDSQLLPLTNRSVKLYVFGFGSDQNGYVFVGVLPKAKEFFVSGARASAISFQDVGASQTYARERANERIQNDASMV
jgi:pimeloyl-ACP methyl ester carboxylesterase